MKLNMFAFVLFSDILNCRHPAKKYEYPKDQNHML